MQNQEMLRKRESGNVLFLILIAVALFAALSYAVTQSTRSGTGSTDREQSILSGASMTQYPTALRTAVIRMVLSGVDVGALEFNSPANFGTLTDDELGVFNNVGGGALYQEAPSDLVVGTTPVPWTYNLNIQVPDLGTAQNELIAFLPGVNDGICVQVNREFNIDTDGCALTAARVPVALIGGSGVSAITEFNITMDENYDQALGSNTDTETLTTQTCAANAFAGQASGCFNDGTRNIFYSVLLER